MGEKPSSRSSIFGENDFEKKEDAKVPIDVPVLVGFLHTRLKILGASLSELTRPFSNKTVFDLREQLKRIPRDSFPVKKVWPEIADAWDDSFWDYIANDKIEFFV